MYVDRDYAESRLHGTLVRHEGKPVMVTAVRDSLECEVKDLLTGNYSTTHLDNLDLKSPPLGFVNHGGNCYYLTRKPMRNDWRQGVRTNSVVIQGGGRVPVEVIAQCMAGEYPTKSVALSKLRDGQRTIAISREFSLTRKRSRTTINYKWYGEVGKLTSKGAVLNPKWEYLSPKIEGVV